MSELAVSIFASTSCWVTTETMDRPRTIITTVVATTMEPMTRTCREVRPDSATVARREASFSRKRRYSPTPPVL